MIFNGRIKSIGLVEVIEGPEGTDLWLGSCRITGIAKLHLRNGRPHRNDGPAIICQDGSTYWYQEGVPHRADGPAVEGADGTRRWYRNGRPHRDDGPAVERSNGTREWHRNGVRHREDGPAIEDPDGYNRWFLNGALRQYEKPDGTRRCYLDDRIHCEDGPAVVLADGTRMWCRDGELHRDDGPAMEIPDGTRMWWSHGRRHRLGGPAVEWANGEVERWVEGECVDLQPGVGDAWTTLGSECRHAGYASRGGGTGQGAAYTCDTCRRALEHLREEVALCGVRSWPEAYHPVGVVCSVLEYAGLDGIAAELRMIAVRDHERRARWYHDSRDIPEADPLVILRYSYDNGGPARLSALGRIPVMVGFVDNCEDDYFDWTTHCNAMVPVSPPLGRSYHDCGRCYEDGVHDVHRRLGDDDYYSDDIPLGAEHHDAIALDRPDHASEFGADDGDVDGTADDDDDTDQDGGADRPDDLRWCLVPVRIRLVARA